MSPSLLPSVIDKIARLTEIIGLGKATRLGICCILVIYKYNYKHSQQQWRTSMNERTHFFIKIYLPLFILERVDVGCVWEVNWRRGQTATYWPKVLLTIAALISHSGWATQSWVTEGPSPLSGAGSHSAGILSNWNWNWLKPSVAPGYIIVWRTSVTITEFNQVHSSRWYSDVFHRMHLFTLVHLLIDSSVEGQYVTNRELWNQTICILL